MILGAHTRRSSIGEYREDDRGSISVLRTRRRETRMTAAQRSRTGFWILIGLLAASGLAMAFIVVFGMFESIAYSLVWRVFVADLYLIAVLAAQHAWLRWAAWIGIAVTFVLGIVNAFRQYARDQAWQAGEVDEDIVWGEPETGWDPWSGFSDDLEFACHQVLFFLIGLSIISFAYRWLRGERVLRGIYWFTFGASAVAAVLGFALILDGPGRWEFGDGFTDVFVAVLILALTAAAIVIIAGFVQRRTVLAREREAALVGPAAVPGAAMPPQPGTAAAEKATAQQGAPVRARGLDDPELRVLVREVVEEVLAEREQAQRWDRGEDPDRARPESD